MKNRKISNVNWSKRIFGIALSIIIILGYFYFRPNAKVYEFPEGYEKSKIEMISKEVIGDVLTKDFKSLVENSDIEFKEELEKNEFPNKVNEYLEKFGSDKGFDLVQLKGAKSKKGDIIPFASYNINYEKETVNIKLYFNKDYKIVAMLLK